MLTILEKNERVKFGESNKHQYDTKLDDFLLVSNTEKEQYLFYQAIEQYRDEKGYLKFEDIFKVASIFRRCRFHYHWWKVENDEIVVTLTVTKSGVDVDSLRDYVNKKLYSSNLQISVVKISLHSFKESAQQDYIIDRDKDLIKLRDDFTPYMSSDYVWIGHEGELINYDGGVLQLSELGDSLV